ncbi:hypothetical protein L873DRAFT_1785797 [Choiromyces venosus 120613-1]|uniref:DNA mismatch repair protein HSM3 N-terminal domain-containing protein n=1 Tax=Choiromyces venosus 120613-1 TaxID=1336337 RepID=A0A3N4K3I7_9PEZI|nr:hypothetical protein L873DRAFT_1785797 [Choiromyces venosus 120613-1]
MSSSTNFPNALQPLTDHLNAILSNPSDTPLDVGLVETFTAKLTENQLKPLIPSLVPLISSTLFVLHEDPSSLTTLLRSLLSTTSFSDILPLATPEIILQTLSAPVPPIQHLGIALLQKATRAVSDAGIIASWTDVIKKLLELMLASEDTGVSSKALDLLLCLLKVDSPKTNGTGLVWRRILEDRGVYELFFKLCSWDGDALPGGKRAKTEGQGRLLEFVAKLAELDFDAIVASRFPEIEEKYSISAEDPCQGLLDFAARHAIRVDDDVMMHMLLLDFYAALLNSAGSAPTSAERPLDYLHKSGIHGSTIGSYLAPEAYSDDFLTQGFVESKAAEYIATYVSLHPKELLAEPTPEIPDSRQPKRRRTSDAPPRAEPKPLTQALLERIQFRIEESAQHPHSPSLGILTSLPPSLLTASYPTSVISKIPLSPPQASYISTLSSLFSTREIYFAYSAAHPELWNTLLKYASTPALRNEALASLDLIEKLSQNGVWGLREVLESPGVMTYLITPNSRYAAGGDPESSAFKISVKKWETLNAIERVLREWRNEVPGATGWGVVIAERMRVGVWGSRAIGEVATAEM